MTREMITSDEEGKRVLNTDGTVVGRIVEVRDERAYVDPNPSLTDTIKAKLGWGTAADDAHPLDAAELRPLPR